MIRGGDSAIGSPAEISTRARHSPAPPLCVHLTCLGTADREVVRRPTPIHSFLRQRQSPPLPVQQPSGKPIDRPRTIAQRYILPAAATGMPALTALPALFVSFKAKRAPRISASAIPARWRYPVMIPSSMLAISTDRHISFGFSFFVGRAPVGERAPTTRRISLPNHRSTAIPPPAQRPRQTPPRRPNGAAPQGPANQIREQHRVQNARLRFPFSVHRRPGPFSIFVTCMVR